MTRSRGDGRPRHEPIGVPGSALRVAHALQAPDPVGDDAGIDAEDAGETAHGLSVAAPQGKEERYLRTSPVPKLVIYGEPGSILPGSTAIGLGTPNARFVSVGKGFRPTRNAMRLRVPSLAGGRA